MISDPYVILGVSSTADDETIRAAYLAAIRACPPERDRLQFERVRSAFESIATVRDRISYALFDETPPTVDDLLAILSPHFSPRRPNEDRLQRILRPK